MLILVLNCGSSSVKFQVFDSATERVLASGLVERVGTSNAIISYRREGAEPYKFVREIANHEAAIGCVIENLTGRERGVIEDARQIGAIGHRVVHGGEIFTESVLIDAAVRHDIENCIELAPLHNPANLKGIQVCEKIMPGTPQVAVFDTAFHTTLPKAAYLYGIPVSLNRKYAIRRYGFHGTSHQFVARKAAEFLGRRIEELKIITLHLGNGSSVAAIDGGRSVDTSMGFTPLEGLVMGTRSGDIDPAILPFLMEKENLTLQGVNNLLNKNSGLLGLSENSNDVREIVLEMEHGNEQCRMALEVFAYRIRKYVGAYAAALGGLDAVVFTAGIGQNSPLVRRMSLAGLGFLGIDLDPSANDANATRIGKGPVEVLVIPTDEELAIVRETVRILAHRGAPPAKGDSGADRVALPEAELVKLLLLLNRNPQRRLPEILESFNQDSSRRLTLHELELLLDSLDVRHETRSASRA